MVKALRPSYLFFAPRSRAICYVSSPETAQQRIADGWDLPIGNDRNLEPVRAAGAL